MSIRLCMTSMEKKELRKAGSARTIRLDTRTDYFSKFKENTMFDCYRPREKQQARYLAKQN